MRDPSYVRDVFLRGKGEALLGPGRGVGVRADFAMFMNGKVYARGLFSRGMWCGVRCRSATVLALHRPGPRKLPKARPRRTAEEGICTGKVLSE